MTLEEATREAPIIAILRGVKPDEVCVHAEALIRCGIRAIEVPLNSPDPLRSVSALSERFSRQALIGAGTVLAPDQVDRIADAGGRIIVTPNTEPRVIARALELGLTLLPGMYTPSEAFAALAAGARMLKLFPANAAGPGHLAALKAVLPPTVPVYAVGDVKARDLRMWREAGASGLGLGSELYRAGQHADETFRRAQAAVSAAASA